MRYPRFLFYNILGAVVWTIGIVLAGYFFGSFTIVKENMSLLIIAVIAMSAITILFILYGVISGYLKQRKSADAKKE